MMEDKEHEQQPKKEEQPQRKRADKSDTKLAGLLRT